jgi:hypothetical protein
MMPNPRTLIATLTTTPTVLQLVNSLVEGAIVRVISTRLVVGLGRVAVTEENELDESSV